MFSLKIFTILLITGCVYADPIWDKGLQKFIKEFEHGNGEKNIKPMDPMIIDNIDVPEEDLGINSHFPELIVSGIKDAVVSGSAKNDQNVVNLDISFSFDAAGTVKVQFPKKNKELEGIIKYEADIKSHISYSVANDELGPETVTCEASNAKYTIGKKFIQILENDPDTSAIEPQYDNIHGEHVKKVSCVIAKAMLKTVFDNLRAAAASGL